MGTEARRRRKPTVKQRLFVREYLRNGRNGTRAAQHAYNTSNAHSAHSIASKNLRTAAVREELMRQVPVVRPSVDAVFDALKRAFASDNVNVRFAAYDRWARIVGLVEALQEKELEEPWGSKFRRLAETIFLRVCCRGDGPSHRDAYRFLSEAMESEDGRIRRRAIERALAALDAMEGRYRREAYGPPGRSPAKAGRRVGRKAGLEGVLRS